MIFLQNLILNQILIAILILMQYDFLQNLIRNLILMPSDYFAKTIAGPSPKVSTVTLTE